MRCAFICAALLALTVTSALARLAYDRDRAASPISAPTSIAPTGGRLPPGGGHDQGDYSNMTTYATLTPVSTTAAVISADDWAGEAAEHGRTDGATPRTATAVPTWPSSSGERVSDDGEKPQVLRPSIEAIARPGGAVTPAGVPANRGARDDLLYFTNFESSEGFGLGFLDGQADWSTFASNTVDPVISDAHPLSGSRHLRINGDPYLAQGESVGGFSPSLDTRPPGHYTVDVYVHVSDTGGADYYVVPQAPSQGLVSAYMRFTYLGDIYVADDLGSGLEWVNTGIDWYPGSYVETAIEIDTTYDTINYYYGGYLIYSSAIIAATSVEEVVLFSDNYHYGDVGDFDWLGIWGEALTGACCSPSGSCSIKTESECDALGREYQGDGTSCTPNPCSGACCFPDGSCLEIAATSGTPCYLAGGAHWFSGEDCSPSPCTGACCFEGETCLEGLTRDECEATADSLSWGLLGLCSECPPPPDDGDLCGFQVWLGSDADPVNTATGNFHYSETDLSIASRGRPLMFQRFYNSLDPRVDPPLGAGWSHTYNVILYPDAGVGEVAVRWADGAIDRWTDTGSSYEPVQWDCHDELAYSAGTWTVTKTNLDVYEFDADGMLTSITDMNGNTVTLAYNVSDQLEIVTDPAGRSLTLAYYDSGPETGLLHTVGDWSGRSVSYNYEEHSTVLYLTDVTDVLGQTVDYTYAEYGGSWYLATITDQRNPGTPTLANTYDADGRVLSQDDGRGNTTTFGYGGRAENETVITRTVTVDGEKDARVLNTVHAHDPEFKKQLMIEDPLSQTVDYGYWNFERTVIVDRNGNVTQFEYDERGNVLRAIEADDGRDPNGPAETNVEYGDPNCPYSPTKRTDALGYVTEWTYDDACNVVVERRYLDLAQTQFVEKSWTYNGAGQRLTETDERGNVHQWVYDGKRAANRGNRLGLRRPQQPGRSQPHLVRVR